MYKVLVRTPDGRLVSAWAAGVAEVTYFEDGTPTHAPEWLQEQGYGLTCFHTLRDAQNASHPWGEWEIWEVGVAGEFEALPQICWLDVLRNGYATPLSFSEWPRGTVMVEEIRLVQRVGQTRAG